MLQCTHPDTLEIFVNDLPVGTLHRDSDGFFDFRYVPGADPQHAVSLSMPVTTDPDRYLECGSVHAPFQVSLPEGVVMERLRTLYKKDVDLDEPFDLLRLVGRNSIGRVTAGGKRQIAPVEVREVLLRDARSSAAAQRLWQSFHRFGLESLGVSGAMPKMLVNSAGAPEPDRPGTMVLPGHIVKFDDTDHYGASVLEYVCMTVCGRMGFQIPNLELSPSGDALIIQRFDIREDGRYLGFEDACALAGYQRNQKYQGSVEEIFVMSASFISESRQAESGRHLLRAILVNDLLRNGDAHLKNFALLYDHPDDAFWSPTYDVLSTTMFYPDDRPALAWDSEHEVDQVWLEDSHALAVLSRLSSRSAAAITDDYQRLGEELRAAVADVTRGLKELPMDADRRLFVERLPQHFDSILEGNSLYQNRISVSLNLDTVEDELPSLPNEAAQAESAERSARRFCRTDNSSDLSR